MIAGLQAPRQLACAGLIVVAGIVAVTAPIAAQQPSFSARADYVRVDVEVRRGNAVVAGLTAADFEVLDNGVPQRVEIVAPSAFPVSVVLALDMSASLNPKARAHLTGAGTRVIDALKAGESAALVTFNERVAIRSTFTADAARLRELVAAPAPSGDTALYDAAHTAMLVGTAAPGRSIVILFSDGDDTASFLPRTPSSRPPGGPDPWSAWSRLAAMTRFSSSSRPRPEVCSCGRDRSIVSPHGLPRCSNAFASAISSALLPQASTSQAGSS